MSQKPLHDVLAQPLQAGIYHLPSSRRTALKKAAGTLGFTCFSVNFGGSGEIAVALGAFGRDLDFPDWYGSNLDALSDCLTDLSWHAAPGYVIIISGADALHADAETFATLNEVLTAAIEAWQAQDVPLWVFYDFAQPGHTAGLPTLP